MKIKFDYLEKTYSSNLSKPIDISIPLISNSEGPKCFWAPNFVAEPLKSGEWIGDTNQGGSVNFKNVKINPHGNGTHTECVGHIAKEIISINSVLTDFHCMAQLISLYPQKMENGDRIVTLDQIKSALDEQVAPAIVLRTLPNEDSKRTRNYSGTNPPYLDSNAITYLVEQGVKHLLLDLPSVDREEDEGKLSGHKAFWNYPAEIDTKKTITEMVFVDNAIQDGLYLLNLQIASFDLDASPSKPVLYRIDKE